MNAPTLPPALPDQQPDHDTPASAPVVNHAGGIARLMGDAALFARVLARFRNEYRHAAAGIRKALDAQDSVLAQRLAHTLKGAAAMIEAVPLRQQAQALEQEVRAGAPMPQLLARLAWLDQALESVLHELDALSNNIQEARPIPAPADKQDQVMPRLRTLLEDGNGDAVDLVRDAAGNLVAELGEERYRRLAAAIEVFDFDGALALLAAVPLAASR